MTTGNALNANFAANQLIYASTATDLSGLATATNALLVTSAGGVPSFSATIPLLVQQNITELGTITSMTAPLSSAFGGTGVNNSTNTITLGGNLATSGTYPLTLTLTGATNVTLPTTGTLITADTAGVLTVSGTINRITSTGGQTPVIDIDANYVGQTSIITLGTITTGTWFGSQIDLAHGGTNANLLASNGGIFYSTATAAAILSGTSTANRVLLSGSSSAPSWSTATYPTSTTADQILYSSANNTIAGLATASDGVLITSVAGVPSISSILPYAVQQNITELGSISYMITPLGSDFGGTGVDNNGSTITIAGNLTTTGAYPVTFNFTGDTNLTFPLSGTLATVAGIPSLPLITSQGGTGVASPTAHGILVGEGSSPLTSIVLGAGQLLIGTTASDPAAATLTAGNAITIGSSSGAITVGVASNPVLPGTAGVTLPQGNTAAQAGAAGTMRFNTQTNVFEGTTDGIAWSPFSTATSGVVSVGGTTDRITSSGGTTPIIDIASTYVGQTSITTLGTITTGTWTGTAVDVAHGGTGNTSTTAYAVLCGGTTSTASLQQVSGLGTAGYVLTSNGAAALPTWQAATGGGGVSSVSGTTGVITCSPSTGAVVVNIDAAYTGQSSITTLGTITTGTWHGSVIDATYGGTGVNNGTSTITLGGSLTTSGAFNSTFTMTAATAVTFPTSGTLATTSQLPTLPLSLANGGLNANLTASNGGIFYSTGSAGAILSGTATTNQILMSGSNTTPSWSTATYPATTTINGLLFSTANNTVSEVTAANSAVLVSTSVGLPSWSGTMTNGQVIIGSTGATPTAATLTAGANVTITNGAGTITIASTASSGSDYKQSFLFGGM